MLVPLDLNQPVVHIVGVGVVDSTALMTLLEHQDELDDFERRGRPSDQEGNLVHSKRVAVRKQPAVQPLVC